MRTASSILQRSSGGSSSSGAMADAEDEFARFEREMRALEAAAPVEEEEEAAPVGAVPAPALPPAARVAAATASAPPVRTAAPGATIFRAAVAPTPGPAALPPPPPPPPPNPMLAGFYAAQARPSRGRALHCCSYTHACCASSTQPADARCCAAPNGTAHQNQP
jgi:hypothetical protein